MGDTILKDEHGTRYSYDRIATQSYLAGQPVGLDAAAAFLKRQAVKLFEDGKDAEAVAMRKLAERMVAEVKPGLEEAMRKHLRDYPEQLSDDEDDE